MKHHPLTTAFTYVPTFLLFMIVVGISHINRNLVELKTEIIKAHMTLGVLTCKQLNDTREAFEECLADDEFTNNLE